MVSTIKVSTCTVFTVHTMPLEINKDRKTRMSLTHPVHLTTNCSHCFIALGFCTRVQYSQCHLKQQESKKKFPLHRHPEHSTTKLHCTHSLLECMFSVCAVFTVLLEITSIKKQDFRLHILCVYIYTAFLIRRRFRGHFFQIKS